MLTLAGSASIAGWKPPPEWKAPCATRLGGERHLHAGAQLTSVTSRKSSQYAVAAQGSLIYDPGGDLRHEEREVHLREVDHPERKARVRVGIRPQGLPYLGGRLAPRARVLRR
jgi:hypothetical protein